MAAISELKWTFLTGLVNEMKSPNTFLQNLLFSNHQTVPTEDIEFSVLNKSREIAPFVRKNGEGIMVGGYTSQAHTVQAPNIRIKRPFTPSELLYGRRPGTVIYSPGASMQMSAIRQHIARDMQVMADLITNAQEWLVAMAIQGTITYEVADQEVFQITYPKPAGNNITLSVFWDAADPTTVDFNNNLHAVKRVINDEVGLTTDVAILGTEAADAFRSLVAGGYVKTLDLRHVSGGNVDFTRQFMKNGAIYLGNVDGIDFWEYGRTATLNGSAQNMIRPKYAEFLSLDAAAERIMYYGAIPDMKVLQGRLFQAERFSKSWEQEDPSAMMVLTHSRPLPVPRRPGAGVSVKVVSD